MQKSIAVIGVLVLAVHGVPETLDGNCTKPTECNEDSKRLYEGGQEHTVCLAWTGDADRVALALLQLVLTEQGFCRIALCMVTSLCNFVPTVMENALMIGYGSVAMAICNHTGYLLDVVGSEHFPGRVLATENPGKLRMRLHVAFSHSASLDPACFYLARTPAFYSDTNKLRACNFEQPLPVYVPDSRDNISITVEEILQDMNLAHFEYIYEFTNRTYITRTKIDHLFNSGNISFLFIDYELWSDEPRVGVFDLPDSPRFVEIYLQSQKARLLNQSPVLFESIQLYRPKPRIIRELLVLEEKETNRTNPSHRAVMAAEQFKYQNQTLFVETAEPTKSLNDTYRIVVYRCKQDQAAWATNLVDHLRAIHYIITNITTKMLVYIKVDILRKWVDCLDHYELSRVVQEETDELGFAWKLGVIAAGVGVPEAARFATLKGISIAAYDAQPPLTDPDYGSLISTGPRVSALVSALRQALAACNWRRAALLSEHTPAAAAVADGLRADLTLREKLLPRDPEDPKYNATLLKTLSDLKEENARVFVLNARAEDVARVIEVGESLKMTREEGYVWLARERPAKCPSKMALLAPPPADERLTREASKWSITTQLTNAMVTMMLGYTYLLRDYDKLRYDHHTNETLKLLRETLQKNLTTDNVIGYNLTFDHEGLIPPVFQLEAYWANSTSPAVCFTGGGSAQKLTDGSRNCTLRTGDAFAPGTCLDLLLVLGVPALLLGVVVVWRWAVGKQRKAIHRRDELLRAEACTALLQRQGGAAAELARCHVERARLRLLGELGAGRHGRVWLAEIVGDKGAGKGRYVAAKEPHEGCAPVEESELLREAGTLASLQHEHVLALVGVCVVGGPPLVLTEQALFGDLQGYLVRRRALCGGAHEEAAHVAAPALTRLAREAALALSYLASRGLVHCDVRAANCLVNERRALKLADFGMARGLGTGEGAASDEYLCQRRKLVPVRWMPPESLTRGVFSPASDMWALGVLILELVTLGERPFGALGSPEVVALVKEGGHARLPASCSRDTRHLALACWRRDPASRPSAADAVAWLADRPTALAPAPHVHTTSQDSDDDSGFGETPPPD